MIISTKDDSFSILAIDSSSNSDSISAAKDSMDTAFEICRNYVMEKSIRRASVIRKEQAYGEMSRGIILVALVSMIWIIIKQIFGESTQYFLSTFFIFLFSLVCFSYRYIQARRINPVFIYSTFCSLVNESKQEDSTKK